MAILRWANLHFINTIHFVCDVAYFSKLKHIKAWIQQNLFVVTNLQNSLCFYSNENCLEMWTRLVFLCSCDHLKHLSLLNRVLSNLCNSRNLTKIHDHPSFKILFFLNPLPPIFANEANTYFKRHLSLHQIWRQMLTDPILEISNTRQSCNSIITFFEKCYSQKVQYGFI